MGALVTPARTTARRFGDEEPLENVLRREFGECDLVLVEGYKTLPLPRIEVLRTGGARPDVFEPAARISDGPFVGSVPTLSYGDWDAIAATVIRLAGLGPVRRPKAVGESVPPFSSSTWTGR